MRRISILGRSFCRPNDTPFEDGTFRLLLGMLSLTTIEWTPRTVLSLIVEFTESYPNKPPSVRFTSKMFHPNGTVSTFEPCRSRIRRSSLCWRGHLSRYSSESLVTNIRCLSYSHFYSSTRSRRTKTWDRPFFSAISVIVGWAECLVACEFGSGESLSNQSTWIWEARQNDCRTKLDCGTHARLQSSSIIENGHVLRK